MKEQENVMKGVVVNLDDWVNKEVRDERLMRDYSLAPSHSPAVANP